MAYDGWHEGLTEGDWMDPNKMIKTKHADMWATLEWWRLRLKCDMELAWHPGHPERRLGEDFRKWGVQDAGNWIADKVADDMYGREPVRADTGLMRPGWYLVWRGQALLGDLREQLKEVVSVEMFRRYV